MNRTQAAEQYIRAHLAKKRCEAEEKEAKAVLLPWFRENPTKACGGIAYRSEPQTRLDLSAVRIELGDERCKELSKTIEIEKLIVLGESAEAA